LKQASLLAGFLLALQAASTALIWVLTPLGIKNEAVFGVFLGIDLISLAMMSYTYRTENVKGEMNWDMILAGSLFLLLLVVVAVFYP
jgi:hypothetical protein